MEFVVSGDGLVVSFIGLKMKKLWIRETVVKEEVTKEEVLGRLINVLPVLQAFDFVQS